MRSVFPFASGDPPKRPQSRPSGARAEPAKPGRALWRGPLRRGPSMRHLLARSDQARREPRYSGRCFAGLREVSLQHRELVQLRVQFRLQRERLAKPRVVVGQALRGVSRAAFLLLQVKLEVVEDVLRRAIIPAGVRSVPTWMSCS